MDRGYFKFWRKAEDSSSWNRGLMYQGLMVNLLNRAVWKKGSYQGHELQPGQFGVVMSHFAESLEVPRSTLQRMVAHLEADGFLSVQNMGNRFSIFSITNWSAYQASEKEAWATDGQQMGAQRATDGQPLYKEEEGKKERIRQEAKASSPELASPPAGAAAGSAEVLQPVLGDPPVITLLLNTGAEHPVTGSDVDQWAELYPAVDVLQELRKMRGWIEGNPRHRKTKAGVGRFIHAWLSKAQDQGGARASPHGAGPPVAKTQYQRDREGQVNMAKLYLAIKAEEGEKHGGQENNCERAVIDVCHLQSAH